MDSTAPRERDPFQQSLPDKLLREAERCVGLAGDGRDQTNSLGLLDRIKERVCPGALAASQADRS